LSVLANATFILKPLCCALLTISKRLVLIIISIQCPLAALTQDAETQRKMFLGLLLQPLDSQWFGIGSESFCVRSRKPRDRAEA